MIKVIQRLYLKMLQITHIFWQRKWVIAAQEIKGHFSGSKTKW